MGVVMKANNLIRIAIWTTFIAIILIITIPTAYKVVSISRSKATLINEKLITEKAKKCIYDGNCTSNKVTLKTLYDLEYIKNKIVNPYDKTLYSEDSYVIITKEGSTFYLK